MIISICMDYDDAIKANRRMNDGRLKNLEIARKMIYFIPFSIIIPYLLFQFLSLHLPCFLFLYLV